MPITGVKQIDSPPDTNSVDMINILNDLSQAIQVPIRTSNETWTSPQKKIYKSVKISFNSKHNPLQWLDLLINFSGLKVTTIKYDPKTNNWQYEGAIYVR